MRKRSLLLLSGTLVALGALPAIAGVIDVYPNTPALSDTAGSVKGMPGDSAPGFGDGSWQATGVKTNYYVTPEELFGHAILISDIASIAYWTKQDGFLGSNWNLYLYTAPTASDNSAGWYKSRLVGIAPDGPAGWNQQSTSTLNWSDPSRNDSNYSSPVTWAAIQAGSVTWPSGTPRDYRSETVEFFSLQTDSGANSFQGLVDGLRITLTGNESAAVNFETPEPGSWSLFAIGAVLVCLGRRYRK